MPYESLTSEDPSDDEAFYVPKGKSANLSKKFSRNDITRRKLTFSEQKLRRTRLNDDEEHPLSNPSTPSSVVNDRVQNLEKALQPHVPLVPEAVNMEIGRVQNLEHALEATREQPKRRCKKEVDYSIFGDDSS